MRWGRHCSLPCVHRCRCRRARASRFSRAHAARRTVHRAPRVYRAAESGRRLWRRAHSARSSVGVGGIVRRGGDGGREAGARVEDTVHTLVKVARAAPRATQLGLGASSSFFRAAEWTRSAVHGRTLPGARKGGVEEGGGGEAGTTIQHTVRPLPGTARLFCYASRSRARALHVGHTHAARRTVYRAPCSQIGEKVPARGILFWRNKKGGGKRRVRDVAVGVGHRAYSVGDAALGATRRAPGARRTVHGAPCTVGEL